MKRFSFLAAAAMATALMGHAGEMPDFADFDTDADGLISKAEFVAYKTADGETTEEAATEKFAKIDVNADGNVTVTELNTAIESWRAKAKDSGTTGSMPEGY